MAKIKNKTKSTYEREELVEVIVYDILSGVSRYRIKLKLDRDNYDGFTTSSLSRATKYNLIQEAYTKCEIPLEAEKDKMRNLQIARLEDMLEESRDARDRQNALGIIKEINKLTGIYPTENVTVSGDGNLNVRISFGIEEEK